MSTFFALCGRTLPLWTLTLPNFGFFMFSGFSDIASSNEIKRKSTFTNNRPYTWAAEIQSKIEKKPVFKNTRKKACDFYEQGFLLRWFSTRNKESPSCRKMFGESYVAPTRRSQKILPKKNQVERSTKCDRNHMNTWFANAEKSVASAKSHFGLTSNEACSGCKLLIQNRFS